MASQIYKVGSIDVTVHEGRDGHLFLAGALAAMFDQNSPRLPASKLDEWVKVIATRAARLQNLGIRYVHMPAPEKLTIYDNKLTDPVVDWRLSPALRLGERLQRSPDAHVWLNVVPALRAARDEQLLYSKTDSHWNAQGAFIAYKLVCERIGIDPDPNLLSRSYVDHHAVFDLGARLSPPLGEWFKQYDFRQNATRCYCNWIAKHLESAAERPATFGGSHVRFRNDSPSAAAKKILIFGDSFSSQRADSLTGMLAETAREVEFVWSLDLDWSYIERARPDVVIYEHAERGMAYIPQDHLSLRALFWKQGVSAKLRQWKERLQLRPSQQGAAKAPA